MKGLNIKKLAAIGVGAALVGAALAPAVGAALGLTKADLVNDSGQVLFDVVAGANAAPSDWLWAGNIAAKLAQLATVEQAITPEGVTCTVQAPANPSVELAVGGTVSYGAGSKEFKVNLDSGAGQQELSVDNNVLTHDTLGHLAYEIKDIKYNGVHSSITEQEKIAIGADIKFDPSADVKDLVAYISNGDFRYIVDLGDGIPIYDKKGSTDPFTADNDDSVKVLLFGKTYLVDTVNMTATTPYIKLIESKEKPNIYAGDQVSDLDGRGSYEGQKLTVKVAGVAQTSGTGSYVATFELYDANGSLIDSETVSKGANLAEEFVDADGDAVLATNIYVDGIYYGVDSGKGYVQLTVGTGTIELYEGKGYPYDPNDTSGSYAYVVDFTYSTDTNKLTQIIIKNSQERWEDNNPLYPNEAGQSLTGHEGNQAVFGNAWADGTLGKGYARALLQGWETDESYTTVKVGKVDSSFEFGGLSFTDSTDVSHKIPFAIRLSGGNEASDTFNFDGYTYWYKTYTSSSDTNFHVANGDYVNGRQWTISAGASAADVNITIPNIGTIRTENVGNTFTVDGVTYTIVGVYDTAEAIDVDVNAAVEFRKDNSNGSLIYNTSGDSADDTYGRMLLTTDSVFDANTASANLGLTGTNNQEVRYAAMFTGSGASSANKLWLLMDAQSFNLQYDKTLQFAGSYAPTATEPGTLYSYFVPDSAYFNSNYGTGDNSYGIANITFDEAVDGSSDKDVNIFIDTADGGLIGPFENSNLTWPSQDVIMEDRDISLKSGTGSTFLKGAYTDYGTKVTLDEDNDMVVISSPQNRPMIRFYVLGTEVSKEVSGENLTVAEGETGETTAGTKITVTKINYDANCTVEGTASGTSVRVVPVGQLVYSDAETLVAQNHIIVGGYYVNALARDAVLEDGSALEDVLTDETSAPVVARTQNGDIVVAGYTAEQTAEAAQELIRELESLIA